VPYHLATPQGKPFARGNINVRQRPQRVAVQRASNKSGRFSGVSTGAFTGAFCDARHPRERLLRGAFGGESGEHARSRSSHPRSRRGRRATARQDRLRSPATARPQPLASRLRPTPRKRRPFSRTRCVVSIQARRTRPWSRPQSAATTRRPKICGRVIGSSTSPRARRFAEHKKGTSAPGSSATRISSRRDSPSCHGRVSRSRPMARSSPRIDGDAQFHVRVIERQPFRTRDAVAAALESLVGDAPAILAQCGGHAVA
jgi:hypothetical protein